MNELTLKALKESIAHWKRLYTGTTIGEEDTGSRDCALCKLFHKSPFDCSDCPIKVFTGNDLCRGTPYVPSCNYKDKNSPAFKKDAKVFHNWLVGLLPVEKKNHVCQRSRSCSCSLASTEPDEDCNVHGLGEYPPRCCICGRFVKVQVL